MKRPLRLETSSTDSQQPKPEVLQRRNRSATAIMLGILILLVATTTLVYVFVRESAAAAQAENSYWRGMVEILREKEIAQMMPTAIPPATATPVPTCDPYAGEIGSLQDLIQRGKFAMASELANLHLRNRKLPPCPDAKLAIAELGYSAALNELFASHDLDGRAALLRWQDAESQADRNSVPIAKRWPALMIVAQAYNAGFWELARAAFRQAWNGNAVNHTDIKAVRQYYAVLRNWGYANATRTDAVNQREGLVLLRTADEISRAYGLQNGEANQDLRLGLLRVGGRRL